LRNKLMSDIKEKSKEAAEKVQGAAAAAGDAVTSGAKTVAAKVSEAVSNATDSVMHAGSRAVEYVREGYDQVGDHARHAYEGARDTGREWESRAEGFVKRQPVKALLLAAGLGIVVGLLWKRR
jgi:ElaB/YqjD/DUF883 family membrane-anchored ribosome-binding protein